MSKEVRLNEVGYDPTDQTDFYESSVKWVESLIERHDPERRFIGVLDNDIKKHPYQDIRVSIVPAYNPPFEAAETTEDRLTMAYGVTAMLKAKAEEALGTGVFDEYIDEITALSVPGGSPGDVLRIFYERLETPGNNTALVGFHPNIMALPFYSETFPVALNKLCLFDEKSDIFEFCQRNLMPVNPALSVASFKGIPAFEAMPFTTLIKVVPPTRSALQYGMSRRLQRKMIANSKIELDDYLEHWRLIGKSVNLTVDPTASTFEPVFVDGKMDHLRRSPINRAVRKMVVDDFPLVLPVTMKVNRKQGTSWKIGLPVDLRTENRDELFDDAIDGLDKATEELYQTEMRVSFPERHIGKQAIIGGNGLTP